MKNLKFKNKRRETKFENQKNKQQNWLNNWLNKSKIGSKPD